MPFDNDRDEQEQNLLRAELEEKKKCDEFDETLAELESAIQLLDPCKLWGLYFRIKRILGK